MKIADVSYFNRPVPWDALRAAGVTCVMVRGPIGAAGADWDFAVNWVQAKTFPRHGIYGDVVRTESAAAQSENFLAGCNGDYGTEPLVLDAEPTRAEWAAMAAGTLVWPKVTYTALMRSMLLGLAAHTRVKIYTSRNAWLTITTDPAWGKDYENWIAHYNSTISAPDVPDGWTWSWWQYGQQLFNGKPIDVSRENVMAMVFENPTGDYIGIHSIEPGNTLKQVQDAAAAGTRIPAVVQLNDAAAAAGYAPYVDSAFCRYYSADDDSLQGVDDWTDDDMSAWSNRRLDAIEHQATDAQIALLRSFLVDNEPDPPEDPIAEEPFGDSYSQLAKAFCNLILECEKRNAVRRASGRPEIHLGIGCLPQGVPEWEEMLQLVDYNDGQLFKFIRQYGHIWVCHEGVYQDDPIDKYYGDLIPGSPPVAGAGAYNFRWMYLFSILLARGLLVPILIAEFYDGGGYPGDPDGHVVRFSWYDVLIAALPREMAACVIAICGFTCNPGPGWTGANYDDFYLSDQLKAYRQKVRERINGVTNMPNISDADYAALVTANTATAGILAKYKLWRVGDVAIAVANPLQLYDASHNASGAPRPNVTYDINILAVSDDGQWLQVAPALYVRAADVRHK